MKINKFALGMLCASLVAGSANAVDYYLYGSTAYRKANFDAVRTYLSTAPNTLTSVYGDSSSTAPGTPGTYVDLHAAAAGSVGNNCWVFIGTIQGIGSVRIFGTWQGAVGGQSALTGSVPQPMLTPGTAGACTYTSHVPDLGMCDQQPSSVPSKLSPTPGYTGVVNTPVAVITFVVAANAGSFPANFNNVTTYQLRTLYSVGVAPLSQFTGAPADNAAGHSIGVYAVGRDDDSGTRCLFQTDTGLGIPSALSQYGITAGPYTYTLFPVAGINFGNDGGGYASGGNVKSALQIANPGTYAKGDLNGYYLNPPVAAETESVAIGYLAVSDFNGAGLTALNYDGVAYSVAAVEQGQYSYWGYENANIRSTDSSLNTKQINDFTTGLTAVQASLAGTAPYPGTINLNDMQCTRASDGGAIAHN